MIALGLYSTTTRPMFMLLRNDNTNASDLVQDMIQDRLLIATLVATQASIFCELLMITCFPFDDASPANKWHMLENAFQMLMPGGLILSWTFCTTFDADMSSISIANACPLWSGCGMLYLLKYAVFLALALEVMLTGIGLATSGYHYWSRGSIRLTQDKEDDKASFV
ncbi:hypothetical protein DFQ30_009401 [Apophysomyces sp. BC1015]|nr:hypothetical protein DFQ30_009401 [Apophysomyces sp. BC1015]